MIAGRTVPIRPGKKTVMSFTGGKGGPEEAGLWELWTLIAPPWKDRARIRADQDPGERWRRMEGTPGYEHSWEIAKKVEYLRPASAKDVVDWLNSHLKDAEFADWCEIDGQRFKVTPAPHRLEPVS